MTAVAEATVGSPHIQAYSGARVMLTKVDSDEKRKIAATSNQVNPVRSATGQARTATTPSAVA